MPASHDKIKTSTKLSPLAHAVALFRMQFGDVSSREMAEHFSCTVRGINNAKKQLEGVEYTFQGGTHVPGGGTHVPRGGTHVPFKGTQVPASRVYAHAHKESSSKIVNTRAATREAEIEFLTGPQQHQSAFLQNGRIVLLNGERAFWLDRCDGDEDLLHEVLLKAAGLDRVHQPNPNTPIESRIGAALNDALRWIKADKAKAAAAEKAAAEPKKRTLSMAEQAAKFAAEQEALPAGIPHTAFEGEQEALPSWKN